MSSKKLAILQPVMIPVLYDMAVMFHSDLIVLQDNEPWSRKSRVHRAQIRTPDGTQYIHIPIRTEDRKKTIQDLRIDHSRKWVQQILLSLEYNYRNSVYFDFYEPEIRADFDSGHEFEYLLPFIMFLRKRIFQYLQIEMEAEIIKASEIHSKYDSDPDQLCKNLNMNYYFQEPFARHYQRQGTGSKRVKLSFQHPKYRQHYDGFEPGCCLLDLMFQHGPESYQILNELGFYNIDF